MGNNFERTKLRNPETWEIEKISRHLQLCRLESFCDGDIEKTVTYDMAEDTISSQTSFEIYSSKDVFGRFFAYRTPDPGEEETNLSDIMVEGENKTIREKAAEQLADDIMLGLKDPDGNSKLLENICDRLWGKKLRAFMPRTDTMTSAGKNLNLLLEGKIEKNTDLKKYVNPDRPKRNGTIYTPSQRLVYYLYVLAGSELTKEFDAYPHFKPFIALYHTIGNYCPVPDGFNSSRSGSFGSHDYWDLTLMKIREWYYSTKPDRDERIILLELLHNSKNKSDRCVKWLKSFGDGETGWRRFVDTLLMQDYVDKNYEVVPFFEGHSWESTAIPQEMFETFFESVSLRIAKRGIRIALALKGVTLEEAQIESKTKEIINSLIKK